MSWGLSCSIVRLWWRHKMETFFALLALCAGNSPVPGEFPSQRPLTRAFDVFFDMCLNKQLIKQSRRWSFETQSRPLWRHFDAILFVTQQVISMPMWFKELCLRRCFLEKPEATRPEFVTKHVLNDITYFVEISNKPRIYPCNGTIICFH